jgi:voltage-gated potassium channel
MAASKKTDSYRDYWHEIIFEADSPAGKLFDVCLLIAILLSVLAVMMESVESFRIHNRNFLVGAEWFFTLLFTAEYFARIACSRRPLRYIFSFWGLIDLLAILPTFLMLTIPGAQRLAVIRAIRLLRAFRIFKLAQMLSEATALRHAIWMSRSKISVFVVFIVIVVVIVGSTMHVVEGPENGFDSIPISMYWTIVTMTTVGYGDIAPQTPFGMTLAAVLMLLGYSIIIVPTGIVTAELTNASRLTSIVCQQCTNEGHDADARHCKYCGGKLRVRQKPLAKKSDKN